MTSDVRSLFHVLLDVRAHRLPNFWHFCGKSTIPDETLKVETPIDILGDEFVHLLRDFLRVHNLGKVTDDASVLIRVTAYVIDHSAAPSRVTEVVHALAHLKSCETSHAVRLGLRDRKVHRTTSGLTDGFDDVEVFDIQLELL